MSIKKFKCENCGCRVVDEVMVNVTQTTEIGGVDEDGLLMYGKSDTDGGKISCFQCKKCGKVIRDKEDKSITLLKELAEFIIKQGTGK